MPVYYDKARKAYRFEFRRVIDGREYKYKKRLPKDWTRAQAEKYAREREAKLYALATGVEKPGELISDALAEYLTKHKFKDSTIPEGIALMLPYIEGKTISQFPDVVKEYQDDNPHHSPATQRNRIGYIRAGLRWCWKHRIIATAVPPIVMPVVSNQRHVYLKLEEQERLLDAIEDVEARALFTLTFWTACRWVKEILTLRRERIVTIQTDEGEDVFIDIGITKNGQIGRKYVVQQARWCLDYVPWTKSRATFRRAFLEARERVGLTDYRIHDFRHSMASHIISNVGTLSEVKSVLGHLSHKSAERYAHLYPERQMEVLKKVGKK